MRVADFDFDLPESLIAQRPLADRSDSRLLHLDGSSGALLDLRFRGLPDMLLENDVLVVNDTRVIKARLRGTKESGGKVELFIERILADREAFALIRSSHPPKEESKILVASTAHVRVMAREGDLYRVQFIEIGRAHV